jgi:hypothetical protein
MPTLRRSKKSTVGRIPEVPEENEVKEKPIQGDNKHAGQKTGQKANQSTVSFRLSPESQQSRG